MRRSPDQVAACCADILARTLERCGVKVEILGFTTRAWKGGQAARDLAGRRQAGQSRPPQRSAPHHLQAGGCAVLRSKRALALMMREGAAQGEHRRRGAGLAHRRLQARRSVGAS